MTQPTRQPPKTYEALVGVIHDRFDGMSKTYRRIAEYLTQNPNDVAVQSVNAIGAQCNIHPSSFVRFAQALGFSGFKDLQGLFQKRLATAAPGFDARVTALKDELQGPDGQVVSGPLRDLVVRDIASLQELLAGTAAAELERAADMIAAAGTVYLSSALPSEPLVSLLRYVLTTLGRKCILLDASGGLARPLVQTMTDQDVLIAISFRVHGSDLVAVVEQSAALGVQIIAISDSMLSPLKKSSTLLLPVPEHDHGIAQSLAAPICLVQALMVLVAERLTHMGAVPVVSADTPP